MPDGLGISSVAITDLIDATNVFDTAKSSIIFTVSEVVPSVVHDAISAVSTTVATIPGPQGPPGVQNVYVGATAPANPEIGWIWIQI